MDFEVFEVTDVTGFGAGSDSEQSFLPFYAAYQDDDAADRGYFTVQREPRVLSEGQRRSGFRTSYIGSEVFISLVDPNEAPWRGDLRQLGVSTLCTNRDLPLTMPLGAGRTDFTLETAAPLEAIRCLKGPSRPNSPRPGWRRAVAVHQPPLAQLPLAPRRERARGRGGAPRDARALRGPHRSGPGQADRRRARGARRAGGAASAARPARSPSGAGSSSRSRWTSSPSRAQAHFCSAASWSSSSPGTSRSTRSRKPCCARLRAARSNDGCHDGASA